jgi:hypothetical protein
MMGTKAFVVLGVLFVLGGLAALIHPRSLLPAQKSDTTIGSDRYIIETRRIVTVPPIVGALPLIIGAGLIFLGTRKS